MSIRRGVNLPYSGKMSHNLAYFPEELKIRIIRAIPVFAQAQGIEKESV
jgi:hypothetical protein